MTMYKIYTILSVLIVVLASCTNNEGKTSQPSSGESEQPERHDTITIAMTGDIMLGTTFPKEKLPPNDGRDIFTDCDSILRAADVACGNLEGVFAIHGKPRKNVESPRAFMFLMPPKNALRLVEAGFDFMGLANNHIYDFWDEAVTSTEKTLDSIGMGYAGRKECESMVKEIKGRKYGFCAFGHEDYCLRTQDTANVRRIITDLRKRCDILIVSFHGGAEGSACRHLPYETEYFFGDDRGNLRQFTHFAIDCGADIVYGHGPHVVRAIELYNDHLIAYSLGNFATPVGMGVAGLTGYAPLLVARVDEKGRFIDGRIHSFIQQSGRGPRRDLRNIVANEIRDLTLEDIKDNKLNFASDGTLTRK